MYELKRSIQFSNLNLTGTHRKLTAPKWSNPRIYPFGGRIELGLHYDLHL